MALIIGKQSRTLCIASLVLCLTLAVSCGGQQPRQDDTPPVYENGGQTYGDIIIDGAQTYTVVRGDMLSRISRRFYGDGYFFPLIMLASWEVTDPDRLTPGMTLIIPDLLRNLEDPAARARLKSALNEAAALNSRRNRPLDAEGLRRLANSL